MKKKIFSIVLCFIVLFTLFTFVKAVPAKANCDGCDPTDSILAPYLYSGNITPLFGVTDEGTMGDYKYSVYVNASCSVCGSRSYTINMRRISTNKLLWSFQSVKSRNKPVVCFLDTNRLLVMSDTIATVLDVESGTSVKQFVFPVLSRKINILGSDQQYLVLGSDIVSYNMPFVKFGKYLLVTDKDSLSIVQVAVSFHPWGATFFIIACIAILILLYYLLIRFISYIDRFATR